MLYQIKLTHILPFTIALHNCNKNWTHSLSAVFYWSEILQWTYRIYVGVIFREKTVVYVYSHPDSLWVCVSQEVKQVGPISIIWPPIPTKSIFFGSDRTPISDLIELDSFVFS